MRAGFAAAAALVLVVVSGPTRAVDAPSGWLGAALEPAKPVAGADDSERPSGVVVTMIVEDSPAEKAGLRGGDLITGIDGIDVSAPAELIDRIKKLPPDSWVGLRLLRRGAERQVGVRLGTRPAENGAAPRFIRGWIGARVMDIPPKLRAHFGAREDAGVMVSDLQPGGPAEAGGLRLGDVVYRIDGHPVPSAGAFYELISKSGVGNEVDLSVGREGAALVLSPVVDRAPNRPPQ